jgi:hypothetical protein
MLCFLAMTYTSLIGLIGDLLNCSGGVLLAWEAIHQERDFQQIKRIAHAVKEKPLARLRVAIEGVQIVDETDVECAFIRRSARKAVAGCILLSIGFILLALSRVWEIDASH